MKILITGCAGFIGFHLCFKLLTKKKFKIYGIDNLNHHNDQSLKIDRLKILKKNKNFTFYKLDITNKNKILNNFSKNKYHTIIHLAAQAGVRKSISHPDLYLNNNIVGFFNILEGSRKFKIKHLLFSSSSSVYGNSKQYPYLESTNTNKPLSFYAATKKSNEVMAYAYSYKYKLPITVLRLFTVYGPFGRPDMSLFLFTKAIKNSRKVNLFNRGNHYRDFTYIDDAIYYIEKIITKSPKKKTPFTIINISNSKSHKVTTLIKYLENKILKKAKFNLLPMQKGDVFKTYGRSKLLNKLVKNKKNVQLKEGVNKFVDWFTNYYNK